MNNPNNKKVSISELYAIKNKKKSMRKESFEYILMKIHNRMRTVANNNALNCFYEIPPMILGYPLYSMIDAIEYIVTSLRVSGFLVQIIPSQYGVIYISWNPQEINPKKLLK